MVVAGGMGVRELDTGDPFSEAGAALVEAADGPGQACVPPLALGHRLRHLVDALRVREGLVVHDLSRFRYTENRHFSTCTCQLEYRA